MFSFKKIMIVMLAALILGGGMISMSMHAMEQQDQGQFTDRLAQLHREATIKSVGKNIAQFVLIALTVTTAVRVGYKALLSGIHAQFFVNASQQSAQQAHKHFDAAAKDLSEAALWTTCAYYVAKWLS